MKKGNQQVLVIGDRVLIVPDVGEDRSNVGLYLPKWAVERESIQAGRIVEIGHGASLPSPSDIEDEPWKKHEQSEKTTKMQARIGDYTLFLRKAAVEVRLDNESYLIVPYSALLIVVRDV
ncbi:co-chaperone GroES [candidate division KSB1 bacterium]|jgi:co-chaperonin GroES (HSP10)|nr:co-chaperone GroES [candidate division KSB1 bacterium]